MPYKNKSVNIVPTLDDLRNMRIMVVDDIPTNVILIKAMLEHGGFTNIVSASNGQKALEYIKSNPPGSEGMIDVLLLDIIMPAMDGFTLCRHLRNDPQWTDIPIIMVTSEDKWREETARASFDAGAIDIMFKPVRSNELLPRIISALSLKRERDIRLQDRLSLQKKISALQFAEAHLNYLSEYSETTGIYTSNKLLKDIAMHLGCRPENDDSCLIKLHVSNYLDIRKHYPHHQAEKFIQSLIASVHAVCDHAGQLYSLADDSLAVLVRTDNREHARQIITRLAGITEVDCNGMADPVNQGLIIGSVFINDVHIATQHDLLTLADIACDEAYRQNTSCHYEISAVDIQNTVFDMTRQSENDASMSIRLLRSTDRQAADMYFIAPLTDSVFRTIEQLQHSVTASQDHAVLNHRVLISTSAKLLLDEASIAKLKYTISTHYLEPNTYVFMLDEADLYLNMNTLRHNILELAKDGFVFGLQGAGGLYTSETHLQELPLSFVSLELNSQPTMMNPTRKIAYSEAIINKAHSNNCKIIAECQSDVSLLNNLQVDYLIVENEVLGASDRVV